MASSSRQPVVPPQHGAWAFLGLPIALGWEVVDLSPLVVLLGVGFVVAYPASYFLIATLRYPRPERYRKGLVLWGGLGVAIAVVLLLARPWLVWVGLAYLVAFGINLAFAQAHNERSLINDAVFIIECVAIVPVVWAVEASTGGWIPPSPTAVGSTLWTLTVFAALALVGSTMHVRSLIRERRNAKFRLASQVVAGVSLAVATLLAVPLGMAATVMTAVAFGFLFVRSLVVGMKPMKPGVIGVFELVGFLLVALAGLVCTLS